MYKITVEFIEKIPNYVWRLNVPAIIKKSENCVVCCLSSNEMYVIDLVWGFIKKSDVVKKITIEMEETSGK
ncbi:MAG TPA: hypothetical protein PKV92_07460 [Thermodesulfovibrio thiophilus]|nr:hypothetical protein [Thermodesulfovibrio thiophilus]HQD36913.1 hypothetical protein [Thermodesulfovibrio thiophilus]